MMFAGAMMAWARLVPKTGALIPLGLAFLLFLNWGAVALQDRVHLWVLPLLAGGLAKATVDLLRRTTSVTLGRAVRSAPWLALIVGALGVSVPLARQIRESRQIAALPPAAPDSPNVL